MAIPSRSAQIERVAEFINDPENEGRGVNDVAKRIVDGIYDMWTRGESSPPIPLYEGLAFSAPLVGHAYHVAWIGDMWWSKNSGVLSTAWIISSNSSYGSLMPVDRPFWRIVKPSRSKAGAPGNNAKGWKSGDWVSHSRGAHKYKILAVGDRTVLMHKPKSPTMIYSESNAALEVHYRRES